MVTALLLLQVNIYSRILIYISVFLLVHQVVHPGLMSNLLLGNIPDCSSLCIQIC